VVDLALSVTLFLGMVLDHTCLGVEEHIFCNVAHVRQDRMLFLPKCSATLRYGYFDNLLAVQIGGDFFSLIIDPR
jgi:hypothetical protein